MRTKILIIVFLWLAVEGCASLQTEIIRDPGPIASITVGRFVTANPVDDELIREYLKKELAKRDFPITDTSRYILEGTIDVDPYYSTVAEARIVLREYRQFSDRREYSEVIVWSYLNFSENATRKNFAKKLAKEIAKNVSYR